MDDTDTPGVSVDSSGMSVVTVQASNDIPWWVWVIGAIGVYCLLEKH
jgi:uncharacterized membrane protein YdcZ (DUF606 family)